MLWVDAAAASIHEIPNAETVLQANLIAYHVAAVSARGGGASQYQQPRGMNRE